MHPIMIGRVLLLLAIQIAGGGAVLLSAFALLSANAQADDTAPVIFILHSYAEDDLFGPPQHKGVLRAFTTAGLVPERDYRLRTFYMDTRVHNTTPELLAAVGEQALQAIREAAPVLLITLDDKAFSLVGLRFIDAPGISVIYSGINNQLEVYNQQKRFYDTPEHPGHNVSGVYEELHVADAFRVQREIQPDTGKILVVADKSDVGKWLVNQVDRELTGLQGWERRETSSWEEYQSLILAAGKNPEIGAVYPVALLLKDREDKPHLTQEIMRWTAENASKPQLALNFMMCRFGLSGGAVVDYVAMGEQAGVMAVKVLHGQRAGDLPLESAKRFALVFNYATVQRLKMQIPEDLLLAADELYQEIPVAQKRTPE